MVEVVHKEIRRNAFTEYAKYSKDFNLKSILLDEVNTHICINLIYSTTGFKSIDIINHTDESIKNKALENIKKALKIKHKCNYIAARNYISINKKVHKCEKNLF